MRRVEVLTGGTCREKYDRESNNEMMSCDCVNVLLCSSCSCSRLEACDNSQGNLFNSQRAQQLSQYLESAVKYRKQILDNGIWSLLLSIENRF